MRVTSEGTRDKRTGTLRPSSVMVHPSRARDDYTRHRLGLTGPASPLRGRGRLAPRRGRRGARRFALACACQGPAYGIATGLAKRIGLGPAKWSGVGSAKRITTGRPLTGGRAVGEREIRSSFRNESHGLSGTAIVGAGSAEQIAAGSAK